MLRVFLISFFVSFLGSIPPGTINITSMQMAIQGKVRAAYFLATGATIVEFVYVMLVLQLHMRLLDDLTFTHHFSLITACVLTVLGFISLLGSKKAKINEAESPKGRTGFYKGLLLGLLNPLAIPFWIGVTFYLESHDWIVLNTPTSWAYAFGVFLGSIALLFLVVRIGKRYSDLANNYFLVHFLPGGTLLVLGVYHFYQWFAV